MFVNMSLKGLLQKRVFLVEFLILTNFVFIGKKPRTKAPKIQRLVTPNVLQRKRRRVADKLKRRVKKREEAAVYQQLLAKISKVFI